MIAEGTDATATPLNGHRAVRTFSQHRFLCLVAARRSRVDPMLVAGRPRGKFEGIPAGEGTGMSTAEQTYRPGQNAPVRGFCEHDGGDAHRVSTDIAGRALAPFSASMLSCGAWKLKEA